MQGTLNFGTSNLNLQLADVRIMRRAQWFLINLPMLQRKAHLGVLAAWAVRCVGAWLSYEFRCDSLIAFV